MDKYAEQSIPNALILARVCPSCFGMEQAFHIFLRNRRKTNEDLVWMLCVFLSRNYPFGRNILLSNSAKSQALPSLTPVDTQVPKNIKSKTKRCREDSNSRCYWLQERQVVLQLVNGKVIKSSLSVIKSSVIWECRLPSLRVQTVDPWQDSPGWNVALLQAGAQLKACLGAFPRKLSAGGWCIAVDGRDAKQDKENENWSEFHIPHLGQHCWGGKHVCK